MFCIPAGFVTCCISRSCVVRLSDSSDMSASHRHGSVASVASAPRDTRAASMHIRAQGATCDQAVLCRRLSEFFVILGGAELCMLFHVLLQCLLVCSKTVIHTRCDSALQHVSILLGMVRCCVGEEVPQRDESLRRVVFPRTSAERQWPARCAPPQFFGHWRPRRLCLNV